jgi:hypothetical protein
VGVPGSIRRIVRRMVGVPLVRLGEGRICCSRRTRSVDLHVEVRASEGRSAWALRLPAAWALRLPAACVGVAGGGRLRLSAADVCVCRWQASAFVGGGRLRSSWRASAFVVGVRLRSSVACVCVRRRRASAFVGGAGRRLSAACVCVAGGVRLRLPTADGVARDRRLASDRGRIRCLATRTCSSRLRLMAAPACPGRGRSHA